VAPPWRWTSTPIAQEKGDIAMRTSNGLALVLAALALTHCGDDSDRDRTTINNPGTASDAAVSSTLPDAGTTTLPDGAVARTIEVEALSPLKFDPDRLTVRAGEVVTVVLHNKALIEHNIEFELGGGVEVELEENLDDGESGSLQFVAPAPGSYDFYCPVDGHRAGGMTGKLNVVP
jgi:uncharacterized cupredoxin-like copper-binding protein